MIKRGCPSCPPYSRDVGQGRSEFGADDPSLPGGEGERPVVSELTEEDEEEVVPGWL